MVGSGGGRDGCTQTIREVHGLSLRKGNIMNLSAASTASSVPVVASESELGPLLAAWDQAHPAASGDPEWRHLLDEMAHPGTTQAFYRLAAGR